MTSGSTRSRSSARPTRIRSSPTPSPSVWAGRGGGAGGGGLAQPRCNGLPPQAIDFRTTSPTFLDGLRQVKDSSKAHRRHVPIMILVELKDGANIALPTKPVTFDKAML